MMPKSHDVMTRYRFIVGTVLISLLASIVFERYTDAPDAKAQPSTDYSFDTVSLMQAKHVHVDFVGLSNASVPNMTRSLVPSELVNQSHAEVRVLRRNLMEQSNALLRSAQSAWLTVSTRSTFLTIFVPLLAIALIACTLWLVLQKKGQINFHAGDLSWAAEAPLVPTELDMRHPPYGNMGASAAYSSQQRDWVPHLGAAVGAPSINTPPRSLALVTGRSSEPQNDRKNLLPLLFRGTSQAIRVLPPPLCPSLVLPVCEARFGVPLNEIHNKSLMSSECEIGIVGMSQNTLLRAAVKKVGNSNQRVLEIGMPEANSAPRATVGPAAPGSTSLQICGLRGAFYGTLEIRTNGACYVVKDNATVLSIDGSTSSLKLQIYSTPGSELASVRCSSEAFGGVDHVEVRVEPGVDTILVLACVLAVLLFPPHLSA
mmetsp:Transcript_11978/g.18957  ORF Transcript_11978/g.18957 Transcript_11978/m.18957 type:complete len:429 (+) Transcript_11978:37-1323(+)